MIIQTWKQCWAASVSTVAACTLVASADAAFVMSDVEFWVDHSSVSGAGSVAEAALVIDWTDGHSAQAWGFRWDSSQTLTGEDLLASIVAADSRLTADLTPSAYGAFFNQAEYAGDAFGTPSRSAISDFTPNPPYSGESWAYSFYNPTDGQPEPWANGSNPATSLVISPVGMSSRNLEDGSYDVWKFSLTDADYDPITPFPLVDPVATRVPEPTVSLLAALGLTAFGLRRRRG